MQAVRLRAPLTRLGQSRRAGRCAIVARTVEGEARMRNNENSVNDDNDTDRRDPRAHGSDNAQGGPARSDGQHLNDRHDEPYGQPHGQPYGQPHGQPRDPRRGRHRKPNRALALVLAVFTAWPMLCIGLFFVYIVAAMFSIGMGRAGHGLPWAGVVMPVLFLTLLEGFALLVVYGMHLLLFNPQLPLEKKIAWGVAMLIGSVFAMAAYWYLFLWRDGAAREGGVHGLRTL